jgi:hypothetical protein
MPNYGHNCQNQPILLIDIVSFYYISGSPASPYSYAVAAFPFGFALLSPGAKAKF